MKKQNQLINRDMEISFRLPRAARGWRKYLKTTVTFRFDMLAWLECCQARGIEIWQINELQQDELLFGVCYGAAVSSCKLNYTRPFFDYELVRHWLLNVMTNSEATRILQAMEKSRAFTSPQKQQAGKGGEAEKK